MIIISLYLISGNSNGFIGSIPIGGHWAPNSTVGVNALWKNAQKIAIRRIMLQKL